MSRIASEKPDRFGALPFEDLTRECIGGFYTTYNDLSYGFLESSYVNALMIELKTRGLDVQREVPVDVTYRGHIVGSYRLDMVVNGLVVIEVKAGPRIGDVEVRQLQNYLRASGLPVGLLFHYGPKPWFKRMAGPDKPKEPYDQICPP